jgi:hypothetical protein
MDVDGTKYYNMSATFYWSIGTTHTITVPNEIKNPKYPQILQPESWRLALLGNRQANTIQITVINGTSTGPDDPNALEIIYDAIYNYNG